jgi:hypothetical protein
VSISPTPPPHDPLVCGLDAGLCPGCRAAPPPVLPLSPAACGRRVRRRRFRRRVEAIARRLLARELPAAVALLTGRDRQ